MVDQARDLPLVSPAGLALIRLIGNPFIDNKDVVQALRCDTLLTGKLLGACNSPYFGFSEPVASVDQAILVLGYDQVFRLVMGLILGNAMSVGMPAYAVETEELWRHSLTTAMAADIIVRSHSSIGVEPPIAFTTGLLHDVGKLVLAQFMSDESKAAICSLIEKNGRSRVEAEKEVLGSDHCETGACLLKKWGVPEEIVEAVAHHHRPIVQPRPRLSTVTHAANCVAHLVGSAPGWEAYAMNADNKALEALGVTPDGLETLLIDVHKSIEEVDQFMAIV